MGAVITAMLAIMVVGGAVLGAVAWLHHLAGSVAAQARLRRRRYHLLWHAYRMRLRGTSVARTGRRILAARMSDVAEQPRRAGRARSAETPSSGDLTQAHSGV